MEINAKTPLYFLSIPKTAGTTLYHILATYFPPDKVSPIQSLSRFVQTPKEILDNYELIGGHFYYRIQPIIERDPIYITMLRDPVERVISYYAHIKRNHNHYAYKRVYAQTLIEFATDEQNIPLYANSTIRYLGLNRDILSCYRSLDEELLSQNELERLMEGFAPKGFSDEEALETAKNRLMEFAFFGFKERFDNSLKLLCHTFKWELPKRYQRLMTNPNPFSSFDEKAVHIIRSHTELSYDLYNFAILEFEKRIEEIKYA